MKTVHRPSGQAPSESWTRFPVERPVLASFLLAGLILAAIAATFRFYFQVCDDVFVSLLLQGAGMSPGPTPYNLFLNAYLSLGLNALYARFPGVQWYSLLLVAVEALGLWAVLLSGLWGTHPARRTLLHLATLGLYLYLLTLLQWTQVSSLAAIGAVLLLKALWETEDRKPTGAVLGLASGLVLLSFLIRPAAFFYVLVLSLPLWAREGWRAVLTPHRKTTLRWWGTAALVGVSLMGANRLYYDRDPAWAQAVRFLDLQADLLNGYTLKYGPSTRGTYDAAGWSELDLSMFSNWYYLDEEVYSPGKMAKVRAGLPRFEHDKIPNETAAIIFGLTSVECVLWSAVLSLLLVPRSSLRFALVQGAWIACVLFGLWLYLKIPERLVFPALLLGLNLNLSEAAPREGKNGRRAVILLAAALALISLRLGTWEKNVAGYIEAAGPAFQADMDRFAPPPGGLCVIWDSSFPYEMINPFGDFRFFRKMDLVTLAWYQRNPTTKAMLERHGVPDLFRDMVDNPRVTMICTPWEAEVYGVYLREKYGIQARLAPTFQSRFFTAYQARSVKALKNSQPNPMSH